MPPTSSSIKVCQPGWDVRNCPDWAYLFNSDWPSLAIAFEGTATVPAGNVSTPMDHNLGYYPLPVAWASYNGVSYSRIPPSLLKVDKNKVYITIDPAITGVGSLTVVVRCFNIDISKEASYPLPKAANAKLSYNESFGIKFAKNGRLITSKNLNDFTIHSRAQSPAVLQVATQAGKYYNASYDDPGTGTTAQCIVYPLQTSYIPWIFGAVKSGDVYSLWNIHNMSFIASSNTLVLNIGSTGVGSLIVLRDPLFYPNTVRVVY